MRGQPAICDSSVQFQKHSLSAYYVPGSVLRSGSQVVTSGHIRWRRETCGVHVPGPRHDALEPLFLWHHRLLKAFLIALCNYLGGVGHVVMKFRSRLWAEDQGPRVTIWGPCPENCHGVLQEGSAP